MLKAIVCLSGVLVYSFQEYKRHGNCAYLKSLRKTPCVCARVRARSRVRACMRARARVRASVFAVGIFWSPILVFALVFVWCESMSCIYVSQHFYSIIHLYQAVITGVHMCRCTLHSLVLHVFMFENHTIFVCLVSLDKTDIFICWPIPRTCS